MSLFVEFIGCSGAGKTTVSNSIYYVLLSKGINVKYPLELFLGSFLGSFVSSSFIENALLDFLVLPWFLGNLPRSLSFVTFAKKAIWARTNSFCLRLLLLRSVFRKIGLSCYIRRRTKPIEVVLVDEGPIHSAHIIFINGEKHSAPIDYDLFMELVPKPDMVVYIDTPLQVVIDRTFNRDDPPLSNNDPKVLSSFITRAHKMFKILMSNSSSLDIPVLRVDGAHVEIDTVVDSIIACVKNTTQKRM